MGMLSDVQQRRKEANDDETGKFEQVNKRVLWSMVNKSRVIETITRRKEDRQVGAISTMKYGCTKLLDIQTARN